MPTYNSITDRAEAQATIPEEVSSQILGIMAQESAVMRMGRRLPNLSTNTQRIPILSALPTAFFVTGDTGLKETTEVAWGNKWFNVEEIAAIVPISDNVLMDSKYPIWDTVRDLLGTEFGRVFDAAVLKGTNAPASWPADIKTAANAAGNSIALTAYTDMYEAILGETAAGVAGLFGKVEEDGYEVTGNVAAIATKRKLRNTRSADGIPLLESFADNNYAVGGVPTYFPRNGAFAATDALMFAGDWSQIWWAMRMDLSFKIFTEGVISDGSGVVLLNLMQQDAMALRAVMRIAWQVPNPPNYVQGTESSRYPLAVLTAT